MLLPFVRELFAEVEQLPAFTRAASHLRESAGRISVTGLSAAAKALIIVLLRRTVERPFVLVVSDNRAAEELLPVLRAFCELSGAADSDSVVTLPARDVLPFQNLSPHPEIQEERATALWKIATGRAAIVISPVTATTILLRSPEYYADLARVLRRGESFDLEKLLQHLNTVGYSATDVVEMPGQYAARGGILDVYSPEEARSRRGESFDLEKLLQHLNTVGYSATDVVEMPGQYAARGGILDVYSPEEDRPVRIEFFGDEIESMRKFDPASQRSSNPVDEALLLPLTETPVTEELLGSINARLSGKRIAGSAEVGEQAMRDSGAGVFPGWEFYAPVAGADRSIFDLLPDARVILDEPEALVQELDKIWARIEEAHERSGVGNLVRPADLYLTPESWREKTAALSGADFEYLAMARVAHEARKERAEAAFLSQPATPFHAAVAAMIEQVQKLVGGGTQVILAAPNTGEVERLADMFTEYNASYRLGSRTRSGESYAGETSYFAGDVLTTTLLKAYLPDGFVLPEAHLAIFGARDLFDESDLVAARPQRQKSKVSAFLSDFRA